jgi:YfiH family protein
MHDQGFDKNPRHMSPSILPSSSKPNVDAATGALEWVRGDVPYFRYHSLALYHSLVHGVFTRIGGVSTSPYASLNVSQEVGDRLENVRINLNKIRATIGVTHLMSMEQNHGVEIECLRADRFDSSDGPSKADALITNVPNVSLLVKQADCQGVIIFDPIKQVVAYVHCGWRGNVLGILGRVVTRMKEAYGCTVADLLAAISPSLGPCCAEFVNYKELFPDSFRRFMVRDTCFDLWAVSKWQLTEAGLKEAHIEIAGICTKCRPGLFFSYRAEGKTGRFGSVAMLRQGIS